MDLKGKLDAARNYHSVMSTMNLRVGYQQSAFSYQEKALVAFGS